MVRLSERNVLFIVNREISTDKERRAHKIIELVVFEAKCTLAPQEHVFSFDHITKKGKHLR
jgi:hypothetical protein